MYPPDILSTHSLSYPIPTLYSFPPRRYTWSSHTWFRYALHQKYLFSWFPWFCFFFSWEWVYAIHSYSGPLWPQPLPSRSAFVGNKNKRKFPIDTFVPAPPAWQEVDPGPVKAALPCRMMAWAVPVVPRDCLAHVGTVPSRVFPPRWEKTLGKDLGLISDVPRNNLLLGGYSLLAELPNRVQGTSGQQMGFTLLSFCWRSNSLWSPTLFTSLPKRRLTFQVQRKWGGKQCGLVHVPRHQCWSDRVVMQDGTC